ncbi:protease propeptide/inhibitor [Neoconidiobolus thromboides FSU 785]|nr:protease propeptide/inhibitor [Neoconidiobolus thromboides FSU 785]
MSSGHGNYIVTFKSGTEDHVLESAIKDIESRGGKITHKYDTVLKGFAASVPDDHLSTLQSHEHVDNIESDGPVTTQAKQLGIK